MSFVTATPNMNLQLPIPTLEIGPLWASELNVALTSVDSHDHSSGKGVSITPAGISIITDLPFNGNNVTLLKTVRFSAQSSAIASTIPNIGCLYNVNGDLYYNDASGHQIPITASGGVAGTPGSISGMTGVGVTASAVFNNTTGTFTFQAATSVAGNIDIGTIILRYSGSYPTPSGNYIMIKAPVALAAGYSLTLPATLPSETSVMTVNTSGTVINQSATFLLPTGTLLQFAGASIPGGFLGCDGSSVSRTTYAALFAVIGVIYGVGDNSTTFNLPDMRRKTGVGAGGTSTAILGNTVGSKGGEETHLLNVNEIPSHFHGSSQTPHGHNFQVNVNTPTSGGTRYLANGGFTITDTQDTSTPLSVATNVVDITILNTGGGLVHNNIQPSLVINYIIKT